MLTSESQEAWDNYEWENPIMELNVIEIPPSLQKRDDGEQARGRSPPSSKWSRLQLQIPRSPSPEDESKDEEYSEESINDIDILATTPKDLEAPSLEDYDSNDGISDIENMPLALIEVPETPQSYGLLPDTDNSDALGESTPEEQDSDEYSDDKGPDDNEILHFSIEGPRPIMEIALLVARRYEEVFPKVQGKRRLNPTEFDKMITAIRTHFWDYRRVATDYDDWQYVQEVLPLGSTRLPQGGYFTPDRVNIPQKMSERVRTMQQRFSEICAIQRQYQDEEMTLKDMKNLCEQHLRQWSSPPIRPNHGPLPEWKGMTHHNTTTTIRGHVSMHRTKDRVVYQPKYRPLNWEITCDTLCDLDCKSKN